MSLWSAGTGADKMATVVLPTPKQIRFVNNEGRPPAKRRRVDAACQTCRKRKIRCDGKRPQCSTCKENRHECLGYSVTPLNLGASKGSGSKAFPADDPGEDDDDVPHEDARPKVSFPAARRVDTKPQGVFSEKQRASVESTGYGNQPPDAFADTTADTDDGQTSQTLNRRVPYFRWFGPTAIVRGFKQMVVSVREPRRSLGPTSLSSASPLSNSHSDGADQKFSSLRRPSLSTAESRSDSGLPLYDISDTAPVPLLIKHLVEIFFVHLGCNFPFLRKDKVLRMVEDKHLAPILVDAICSLSARFSDNPQLTASLGPKRPKSEYGQAFAQRAKAVVTDTFLCPTVEALQACLLLAYEAFGDNKDSALWMYTGCAIRMASDLGLEKLDGIRIQGGRLPNYSPIHNSFNQRGSDDHSEAASLQEQKASEQERIDTLWAIFTLDRFISSGLGRPATMRREDFELELPVITKLPETDWPAPLPALIQIIHLYGKVSDLLNGIKGAEDMTEGKLAGLEDMSDEMMSLYHSLDPKLTFDFKNFQHYVQAGEGTNFILLHFWFHTLIMVVYCPQLWNNAITQLLPNSNREYSMSSAKTITDILACAELCDPKSVIGNPFTSQPMYFAASAFLMETNIQKVSSPASREGSPPKDLKSSGKASANVAEKVTPSNNDTKQPKVKARSLHDYHAANQNYQCCYRALQQLETYWAGTKYILTALDQKAVGIADPEAFTSEEMESTKIRPGPLQDWKRRLPTPFTLPSPSMKSVAQSMSPNTERSASPMVDSGATQPICWALTGTTNSPNSNLTWLFQQHTQGDAAPPAPVVASQAPPPPPPLPPPVTGHIQNKFYDPIRSSVPESMRSTNVTATYPQYGLAYPPHQQQQQLPIQQSMAAPPPPKYNIIGDSTALADAKMLLELQHSPHPYMSRIVPTSYDTMSPQTSTRAAHQMTQNMYGSPARYDFTGPPGPGNELSYPQVGWSFTGFLEPGMGDAGLVASDMMVSTQEINMYNMDNEMRPWLENVEYLPQDMILGFDASSNVGRYGTGEE